MPWAAFFEQQAKQPAGVHTIGESVLQVFLHTQHHRGQVCMRMREVGVVPPTIDFIVWLWAGRPSETLGRQPVTLVTIASCAPQLLHACAATTVTSSSGGTEPLPCLRGESSRCRSSDT